MGGYANQNVAIFTNNNDGHQTARALINKGVNVAAVIDTRKQKLTLLTMKHFQILLCLILKAA